MAATELHGVHLDETHTTMQIPHRRLERHSGMRWYVAEMPEGDLVIHEWSPRDGGGYGCDLVTFLLDDGSYETVRGPYSCSDIFDAGGRRLKALEQEGFVVRGPAFRIVVGRNLSCCSRGNREVLFEESALACGGLALRLAHATARTLPEDYEVLVRYRNSDRVLRPDDVKEILREAERHHG